MMLAASLIAVPISNFVNNAIFVSHYLTEILLFSFLTPPVFLPRTPK